MQQSNENSRSYLPNSVIRSKAQKGAKDKKQMSQEMLNELVYKKDKSIARQLQDHVLLLKLAR